MSIHTPNTTPTGTVAGWTTCTCGRSYRRQPGHLIPLCDTCMRELDEATWERVRDKIVRDSFR